MTRAQKIRFRAVLETRRNDLIREIGTRRERLAIATSSEAMDQVRSIEDRDLAARNVERLYADLRLVDGALREIREGTFGVCAECGHGIPMRRLEAVPWSSYCVACQERVESEDTYALAS